MKEVDKVLVVILNKNNAKGLEKTLSSLVNQSIEICKYFDVLIMDGGSSDESFNVAYNFAKKYPCIEFRVQKIMGGTGPARLEAIEYAKSKGYSMIIWGDSENTYNRDYIKGFIEKLYNKCDIVGGITRVYDNGLWSHAFAWYHTIHLIIPGLWKKHVPGNNRGDKIDLLEKIVYPSSKRSEDYIFSLLLIKNKIKYRTCISEKSIVYVSMPSSFKEIKKWQKNRVKGLVEASIQAKVFPYDLILWFLFLVILVSSPVLALFNIIYSIIAIAIVLLAYVYFLITSRRFIYKKFRLRYFYAPFIGLILYAIYNTYALSSYIKTLLTKEK